MSIGSLSFGVFFETEVCKGHPQNFLKLEMLYFGGYRRPMMIRASRVRTLRGSNAEY